MPKSSISFNVPPALWAAFKAQTDSLFLSRAPFLDYMVYRELTNLRAELAGLKLSLRAKRHIAGAMKRTGPISVNIDVQPETAAALRKAVREHNLVRDAFMSRLIIFLRSTDTLLKFLQVPLVATSTGSGAHLEEMPSSPLGAMEAVRDDPLFYVRSHLEANSQCGIYRVPLPRSADWAACYLEDGDVPGTAAFRRQRRLDEMGFDIVARDAPVKTKGKTRRAAK